MIKSLQSYQSLEICDGFLVPDDPSYHKGGAIKKTNESRRKSKKPRKGKKIIYENILDDIFLQESTNQANIDKTFENVKIIDNKQSSTCQNNNTPIFRDCDVSNIKCENPVTDNIKFDEKIKELPQNLSYNDLSKDCFSPFTEKSITDLLFLDKKDSEPIS